MLSRSNRSGQPRQGKPAPARADVSGKDRHPQRVSKHGGAQLSRMALLPPESRSFAGQPAKKAAGERTPAALHANEAKAAVRPQAPFCKKSRKKAQRSRFVECKANRRRGHDLLAVRFSACFETANPSGSIRRRPVHSFPYTDKVRLFAHPSSSHLF